MEPFLVALGSALWLGILTSISPCPLATNVAAISYVGKRVDRPSLVLAAGLLYTLGRMLTYFVVALLAIKSLFSAPVVSRFLQQHMNELLGPLLIVLGVLLIDFIPWPWTGTSSLAGRLKAQVDRIGLAGAFVLGLVFALSFCPLSAALFFGSLMSLAIRHESAVLIPGLYGLGTALPVVVFSFILAFGTHGLSKAFNALTVIERWMRRLTAAIFIGVGGYLCLVYLFGVL